MADESVTEFSELDVESVHLVPKAATGLPFLLAKAAADTIEEVSREIDSQRSQPTKKGNTKMGKKELRAQLAAAEAALAKAGRPVAPSRAPMTAETAVRLMKAAADDAQRVGDQAKADGLRKEVATLKLQIAENQRQERPAPSRLGPGTVELFRSTGTLPDEHGPGAVGGI